MQNKNRTLLILGLMIFLANGDNYAVAPLLINISNDLNITISTAAMSVTAYMLSFGVFTLLFGPLSDRFGKARLINIAAVGTAIFSILGSTAFNLPSLLFFRAMNGAFGAGIFPVTMALVGETFEEKERPKALAKVMGFAFLGSASATVIGGALAYLGSWRLVYLVYGVGELILAAVMLKMLQRDKPVTDKLQIVSSYKKAFSNGKFSRLLVLLLFVGITVFGSFTYSGQLLKEVTGYNLLIVGLILSLFGFGTVIGGRVTPKLRTLFGKYFLPVAGVVGAISLFTLSFVNNVVVLSIALFFFGISFISLQPTLIATAQGQLPQMKGTAMALASFAVFGGGAIGTSIYGQVLNNFGITRIFMISGVLILITGTFAGLLINRMQSAKNQKRDKTLYEESGSKTKAINVID